MFSSRNMKTINTFRLKKGLIWSNGFVCLIWSSVLDYCFQHYSGLDEAVYRNIDACKELSKTTRSAFGPHGMFCLFVLFCCCCFFISLFDVCNFELISIGLDKASKMS